MKLFLLGIFWLAILAGCTTRDIDETLSLESDNQELVSGFDWAKTQALAYSFEGDPVGKWFEASLPGREAFCMRDVSHQSYGALMLGLDEHLKNMIQKFCINISEDKDWCSYWEINRDNEPAPIDYTSDEKFWYNLPANFDLIDACYRVFQWTGDSTYLIDPDFTNFYQKSLNQYIKAWDSDRDGLMESPLENHPRGVATYWEAGGQHAETGADLLASQIAAMKAYARILLAANKSQEATKYFYRANNLFEMFNDEWWYKEKDRFYTSHLKNEVFDTTLIPAMQIFSLYWNAVDDNRKPALFSNLVEGVNVEENSYLAEVYFNNGFIEDGFKQLMNQLDPNLQRKEYPENSYTAVGTIITQLVGLRSYATEQSILTRSGLPTGTKWIKASNIPVQNRLINILQVGRGETEIKLVKGDPIIWYSRFPGEYPELMVNGKRRSSKINSDERGSIETQFAVTLKQGQTIRIKIPKI